MAVETTIHIEGLDTLDAALRDLPEIVQEEIMRDALAASSEVIKKSVAGRIHNRTGRTAANLRTEIQVASGNDGGAAAIGAAPSGKTDRGGRTHILRFLEFGTKAHVEPKKRGRLRRWEARAGQTLKSINAEKGPMAFGGKVFSRIKHPGIAAQAPMRSALAEDGGLAIKAFIDTMWRGISAAAVRLAGRG